MPEATRPRSGGGSLTLERGLRVLRLLAEHPDGLSVSEIAEALGTHRAGVYRLISPLVDQRLVHRGPDQRYKLGVGLIELASRVHPQLLEASLPELQRLADTLQATTALTVEDAGEAMVVAVVEPRTTDMHLAYRRGLRHPLGVAASGIAILAGKPAVEGERPEVDETRRRGWAFSHGELLPGASGVAAPVHDRIADVHAAISAVWIQPRDPAESGRAVTGAAAVISAALS
jgi:DNA-binding IclR family transcriptional regulator